MPENGILLLFVGSGVLLGRLLHEAGHWVVGKAGGSDPNFIWTDIGGVPIWPNGVNHNLNLTSNLTLRASGFAPFAFGLILLGSLYIQGAYPDILRGVPWVTKIVIWSMLFGAIVYLTESDLVALFEPEAYRHQSRRDELSDGSGWMELARQSACAVRQSRCGRLRSEQTRNFCVTLLIGALALIAILYFTVGCGRDWVIITGLLIDGVGAVLIAAPDFGFFRPITYSGTLRTVLDELSGTGNKTVPSDAEWYDVFLEEMREILGTTSIPESAEFEIDRKHNSNLMWYKPNPGVEDDKAVNLFNVFTPFQRSIEREEMQTRRVGGLVFLAGILFQIGGLLIEQVAFPTMFC